LNFSLQRINDFLNLVDILASIVDLCSELFNIGECFVELNLCLLEQLLSAVDAELVLHTEVLEVDLEVKLDLEIAEEGFIGVAKATVGFHPVDDIDLLWLQPNHKTIKDLPNLHGRSKQTLTVLTFAADEHEVVGALRFPVEVRIVFAADQHSIVLTLQFELFLDIFYPKDAVNWSWHSNDALLLLNHGVELLGSKDTLLTIVGIRKFHSNFGVE
jgi:hypothetical protein